MFFYNILICQSVPQLWLLGSHCHVYLMSCENCFLWGHWQSVFQWQQHTVKHFPFHNPVQHWKTKWKENKKKKSHRVYKRAKWNSGGRNMSIFQVTSRPADLNTVLVQVYHLGEENTEQGRKKKKKSFICSGIIARHSNNSAQLIYRSKIITTTC